MTSHVYIGLDLGSTSLKIAAFSGINGALLALAGAPVPWMRTSEGACQVHGREVRRLLIGLLSKVSAELGDRSRNVAAISAVGHGGGLYVIDQFGDLLDNLAVSSTDQRATHFSNLLAETRGTELLGMVGCAPWAGQPTLIASDILRKFPAKSGSISSLFFAKDYLTMLLSGVIATDYSDASTAGLLECGSWQPSELAFSVGGKEAWHVKLLAPLKNSGASIGQLRADVASLVGLPSGIPIAMGSIDLFAAMAGVGAVCPGDVAAIFGTWCVNAAIGPKQEVQSAPLHLGRAGVSNVVLLDSVNSVMYMNNSAASMANTTWLASTLQKDTKALLNAAFSSVPGANGLSYVPYINGGGDASAAILGMRAFHTQADIARAVVEGVVALHSVSLNALQDSGLQRKRLFSLGGGAGDPRLSQLLSTMLGEAIFTPGADESGARGAAMFAATSIGEIPTPMKATLNHIEPNIDEGHFYGNYLSNFEALMVEMEPVFNRTNKHLK